MPCSYCERDVNIVSKGLCARCYERKRKTGSLEYKRKGRVSYCSIDGCDKRVVSHGLCDTHRKRVERHGHHNQTRPDDWGNREKHPLYQSWCHMRKAHGQHDICDEWKDFWVFVNDMGDRPSENHRIRREDQSLDFSPSNCSWEECIPDRDMAEYAKEYRSKNPGKIKSSKLKTKYGITLEDFSRMYDEQGGVCKLCGKPENREGYSLSVDHCHNSRKVRGLLCSSCNTALGHFNDDADLLLKASNYIRQDF